MRSLGLALGVLLATGGACRAQDDAADAHAWDAEITILCEHLTSDDPDAVEAGLRGLIWITDYAPIYPEDRDEAACRAIARQALAPAADAIPRLLRHQSASVRYAACEVALALGMEREALPVIVQLVREPADVYPDQPRWLLAYCSPDLARPEWLTLARDAYRIDEHDLGHGASVLGLEEVRALLSAPDPALRRAGLWGVVCSDLAADQRADRCAEHLSDPDPSVAVHAATCMGQVARDMGADEAATTRERVVGELLAMLRGVTSREARVEAGHALASAHWADTEYANAVVEIALLEPDPDVRGAVLSGGGPGGGIEDGPDRRGLTELPSALRDGLRSSDLSVRKRALSLLASLGAARAAPCAVDDLLVLLGDSDPGIVAQSVAILREVAWDSEQAAGVPMGAPGVPPGPRVHASPSRVRALLRAFRTAPEGTPRDGLHSILSRIGEPALPGLRAALQSDDPTRVERSLRLLLEVERRLGRDTPPEVYDFIGHPDAGVRACAVGRLGDLEVDPAVALTLALGLTSGDPDARVRASACGVLPGLAERTGSDIGPLLESVSRDDREPSVRAAAIRGLYASAGEADRVSVLLRALRNGDDRLAYWASMELRELGSAGAKAAPTLADMLRGPGGDYTPWYGGAGRAGHWTARDLLAVTEGRSAEAVRYCIHWLEHGDDTMALWVVETLGEMGGPGAADAVCGLLAHRNPGVRLRAAETLGYLEEAALAPHADLLRTVALHDSSREVRAAAAYALSGAIGADAIPAFRELLREPDADWVEDVLMQIDCLRYEDEDEGDEEGEL